MTRASHPQKCSPSLNVEIELLMCPKGSLVPNRLRLFLVAPSTYDLVNNLQCCLFGHLKLSNVFCLRGFKALQGNTVIPWQARMSHDTSSTCTEHECTGCTFGSPPLYFIVLPFPALSSPAPGLPKTGSILVRPRLAVGRRIHSRVAPHIRPCNPTRSGAFRSKTRVCLHTLERAIAH